MSDPFGGKYLTVGNPYVTALGESFGSVPGPYQQEMSAIYGVDAAFGWAQERNKQLLESGQALLTPEGVVGMPTVLAQLQQHGYVGPSDATSIAQAFKLLKTPPPATPAPGGTTTVSLSTGLKGIPTPVLVVGGVVLLAMLSGKRGLL